MTRISSIVLFNNLLKISRFSKLGSDFPDNHLYTACGFSKPMTSCTSRTVYPFSISICLILVPVSFCFIDRYIGSIHILHLCLLVLNRPLSYHFIWKVSRIFPSFHRSCYSFTKIFIVTMTCQ